MRVGGAAHAHVIGSTCESASPPACHRVNAQGVRPTCESAGPRARRGTKAASTPRQTAPLKLSAHTWSSFAHTPGIWGYSYSHDETTNFNVDFPAPASRKVATKPTRFVRPSSWLPPTSIPIFPHQKAEKSPQNQHVLSYNPHFQSAQTGNANGGTTAMFRMASSPLAWRKQRGRLTCPGITPRWAGCHPHAQPITISRKTHPSSQGDTQPL